MVAKTKVTLQQAGEITLPGRKFLDIIKALPEGASVSVSVEGEKAMVRSGKSRFTLATLPAADFPTVEDIRAQQTIAIPQADLKRLLDKTHFSMAQQDVRYYLNGMLLELAPNVIRTVATDGHRLAYCEAVLEWAKTSLRNRSSCRERACWSCSVCSATAIWNSLSDLIMFAPILAIFASLRS